MTYDDWRQGILSAWRASGQVLAGSMPGMPWHPDNKTQFEIMVEAGMAHHADSPEFEAALYEWLEGA